MTNLETLAREYADDGLDIGKYEAFLAGAQARQPEIDELVAALMDCFSQACAQSVYRGEGSRLNNFNYDHLCLSAFERAQDILIKYGKIKAEECARG